MQYQFVAAALVATVMASPAYAPAYEAPAPVYPVESKSEAPVYPVVTKSEEAPVYPVYTKPAYVYNSTAEGHGPATYPAKTIVYEHGASTGVYEHGGATTIIYEHGAASTYPASTEVVYHPTEGAPTYPVVTVTKSACTYANKQTEEAYTVVTVVKTLTSTINNAPTAYVQTQVETKPVGPAATTVAVVPAPYPAAPAPAPAGPAQGNGKPVQQIGDGQVQVPANGAQNGAQAPPAYQAASNGTSNGAANASGAKSYPTSPVAYTGAASSLSVAGFFAGAGAIAAFFL